MIRKSSCTSVHCGFRIFANLEIPPFGLASLSHAPLCRVLSCHPSIAALHALHCLVYPAVLFYPSCPGCNCQKPHLSSIFHPILPYSPHPSHPFYPILFYPILSYPILSYPSHLSPCTARPGTPGMLSGHFRVRCPSEASHLSQFPAFRQ